MNILFVIFLQLVKEEYKDWLEHHAASEVQFELKDQRESESQSLEQFIALEIDVAEKEELKDWDIYPMKALEVKMNPVPLIIA